MGVGRHNTDIEHLLEADKADKADKGVKRLSWEKRAALIKETFPSIDTLDWHAAFDDVDMLGAIIQDLLKIDAANRHQDGPRPRVSMESGYQRMRQLFGHDYSDADFVEALKALAGGRSLRSLQAKTGLSRTTLAALLNGDREPSVEQMEKIAVSFKKDVSWFLAYRLEVILAFVAGQILISPERSVDFYQKITGKR